MLPEQEFGKLSCKNGSCKKYKRKEPKFDNCHAARSVLYATIGCKWSTTTVAMRSKLVEPSAMLNASKHPRALRGRFVKIWQFSLAKLGSFLIFPSIEIPPSRDYERKKCKKQNTGYLGEPLLTAFCGDPNSCREKALQTENTKISNKKMLLYNERRRPPTTLGNTESTLFSARHVSSAKNKNKQERMIPRK